MRILFWGTSEFALPGLRALIEEGHQVVAAITQPDRPAGRGRKLRPTPVREVAEEEGIPVLTPERPRGEEFFHTLRVLNPQLSVVAAYGHILLPECLNLPEMGSINIHASLLPELRGAAPVNWAIVRGYEETGVTIMRMSAGMDEGPILLQREVPIQERDTASGLYLRLSELGAEALLEALSLLEIGDLPAREQDHSRATYAPKVDRETARIDWTRSSREVANHIRGMDEVPGAWTLLDGEPFKLFDPRLSESRSGFGGVALRPGRIRASEAAAGLLIEVGDGVLGVEGIQPPGGKRMRTVDWLRGRHIPESAAFV
jgi:methionyl-tRNA formyltransferase